MESSENSSDSELAEELKREGKIFRIGYAPPSPPPPAPPPPPVPTAAVQDQANQAHAAATTTKQHEQSEQQDAKHVNAEAGEAEELTKTEEEVETRLKDAGNDTDISSSEIDVDANGNRSEAAEENIDKKEKQSEVKENKKEKETNEESPNLAVHDKSSLSATADQDEEKTESLEEADLMPYESKPIRDEKETEEIEERQGDKEEDIQVCEQDVVVPTLKERQTALTLDFSEDDDQSSELKIERAVNFIYETEELYPRFSDLEDQLQEYEMQHPKLSSDEEKGEDEDEDEGAEEGCCRRRCKCLSSCYHRMESTCAPCCNCISRCRKRRFPIWGKTATWGLVVLWMLGCIFVITLYGLKFDVEGDHGSCDDGILNNLEISTDCGGPFCGYCSLWSRYDDWTGRVNATNPDYQWQYEWTDQGNDLSHSSAPWFQNLANDETQGLMTWDQDWFSSNEGVWSLNNNLYPYIGYRSLTHQLDTAIHARFVPLVRFKVPFQASFTISGSLRPVWESGSSSDSVQVVFAHYDASQSSWTELWSATWDCDSYNDTFVDIGELSFDANVTDSIVFSIRGDETGGATSVTVYDDNILFGPDGVRNALEGRFWDTKPEDTDIVEVESESTSTRRRTRKKTTTLATDDAEGSEFTSKSWSTSSRWLFASFWSWFQETILNEPLWYFAEAILEAFGCSNLIYALEVCANCDSTGTIGGEMTIKGWQG